MNRWPFLVAVVITSCAHPATIPPPPPVIAAEPLEAAFRALITYGGVGGITVSTYCVALRSSDQAAVYLDPPAPLVVRLAATYTNLRSASACPLPRGGPVEGPGRQRVVYLILSDAAISVGDTLTYQGSTNCGGRCGVGGEVQVVRRGENWQSFFMIKWISSLPPNQRFKLAARRILNDDP
jgi:hypothetical protein